VTAAACDNDEANRSCAGMQHAPQQLLVLPLQLSLLPLALFHPSCCLKFQELLTPLA
jgi:hypothetical protein